MASEPIRKRRSTAQNHKIGHRAMQAQPSHHSALRVLEGEIAHLEAETHRQLDAAAKLPLTRWQTYAAYARLSAAKLRLTGLYERRRRLWAEMRD